MFAAVGAGTAGTDGAGAAAAGAAAGAGAGVFFQENKDVADASLLISPVPAADCVVSESPVMRLILPAPAYSERKAAVVQER